MNASSNFLAVVGQPLFGNQWLALLAVLGGIVVLLFAVAGVGRWLAATHPDDPSTAARKKTSSASSSADSPPRPEVLAVIAASVATVLGENARVASVRTASAAAPSVEALMQQWSLEGRREIYSSHKIR
jgi:hypothetical protein